MERKAFVSLFTPSNVGRECAINCYRFMLEIERADDKDPEGNDLDYYLDMQSQQTCAQNTTVSNKECGSNRSNYDCDDRKITEVLDPIKLPGEKSFYKKSARLKASERKLF